jgi:polyisoprenoid-binding protein YceI
VNVHDVISSVCVVAVVVVVPACKQPADKQPKPVANSAGTNPAGTAATTSKTLDDPANSRGTPTEPAIAAGSDKPALPALPKITQWELDPENSSVSFVCKHAMYTNVRGMFQRPSGAIVLDEATPTNSKVSASIDVKTITTGVEERDTHLRSPEFFDADKYPVITFVSTSVTKASDTAYSVTGNLTMHGVTKPVTLAVTASPPFQHYGSIRRGIEATTSVNRQDFGVGIDAWNVPAESGGLLIGNAVNITIDAELVLQSEVGKGG